MQRAGCLGMFFSLLLLPLLGFGVYVLKCAPIRDPSVEFGYYGRFHKATRVISSMPGLSIVETWKHEDITLEDFGFVIQPKSGPPARVDFHEGDAVKESGDDEAIREHVRRSLDAPLTPGSPP